MRWPKAARWDRRALLTEFYQANEGRSSVPVMRAKSFLHLCERKTIRLGDGELIVGERGPRPKAVPTYPELTCHSVEDLEILNSRPKTHYEVGPETIHAYKETVLPYWRGRSMRDRIFAEVLMRPWDSLRAGGSVPSPLPEGGEREKPRHIGSLCSSSCGLLSIG